MNSVFCSINANKNSFLAAGFCPKNLAFARKIMALLDSGAAALPSPLTRTPMLAACVISLVSAIELQCILTVVFIQEV